MSGEPAGEAPATGADNLDDVAVEAVLTNGSLELEGRLLQASNASFLGAVTLDGASVSCIYKPVSGERPLWDFPGGTLAARERAAHVVSEAGGWHAVPLTIVREGRFGPGMVQQWVDVDPDVVLVDVVGEEFDEPGWLAVLEAEDHGGNPVLLVHADDARLRSLAVLDVVINNADRKGGHVLPDRADRVWGCDHGVTFHREGKLRTVLWGWADVPLREADIEALRRLQEALEGPSLVEIGSLISRSEVAALARRVARLLDQQVMPSPAGGWPAIPWPAI